MTELVVAKEINPLVVQQRIERLLEEQLIPRLELVFDQLASPDEWIDIKHLELDLGELSLQQSDDEWLAISYNKFCQALKNSIAKPETQRESQPKQQIQLLNYFLQYGYLPWWALEVDLEQVTEELIVHQPKKVLALLMSPHTRQRWIFQFPEAYQQTLLSALAYKIPISISSWCKLFPEPLSQQIANIYWQSTWESLQQAIVTDKIWKKQLIKNLTLFYPELVKQDSGIIKDKQLREKLEALILLPQCWGECVQKPTIKQSIQENLTLATKQLISDKQFISKFRPISSKPVGEAKNDLNKNLETKKSTQESLYLAVEQSVQPFLSEPELISSKQIGKPEDYLNNKPETKQPLHKKQFITPELILLSGKPANEPEGLYISLAGVVLTHPFLQTLFNRLALLDGELFKTFKTQEKAVHILYYLTTGLQSPIESELVLLKLLCGLKPETVICREVLLMETEKNEVNNVLSSLIDHWPAMEGTSLEELRGSFLIREGKLVLTELGWQVTIEQATFDILLSRLNWGLSPIQYPWMQKMIWVDWA